MSELDGLTTFLHMIRKELEIEEEFDADTPLMSSGIIDSFDVVALLTIIETRYRVTILPEEIDSETFDTPTQMLVHIQAVS